MVALLLVCPAMGSAASPLRVTEQSERISLLPHSEWLADPTALLTLDDVISGSASARFEPIEGSLFREPSETAYWLRFELLNASTHAISAVLEVANPELYVTLFVPSLSGDYVSMSVAPDDSNAVRDIYIRHTAFPIEIPAERSVVGYLRLKASLRPLMTPVEVSSAKRYYSRVERISLWLGFFYGTMVMFALYNLLLLIVSRDTTYLWYSVSAAALLLFFLKIDRLPFLRDIPFSTEQLAGTYGIAILFFTRQFLRTNVETPRLDLVFKGVIGLVGLRVVMTTFGVLLPNLEIVVVVSLLAATVVRARQGFAPAWLILAVWVPPVAIGAVPFAFTDAIGLSAAGYYNLGKIAVLWERVGSSLAVGVRLRLLRRHGIELDRVVHAEQKLRRETQQRYQRLVDTSPFGIAVCDRDLRIEHVNPAFRRIFGFRQDVSGQTLEMPALPLPSRLEPAVRSCLDEGKANVIEQDWKDGDRALSLRTHVVPVLGAENDVLGCQVLIEDVTEEENLRGQLHRAQKLEAVARLAGGVAHDLNNYLTSILGFSELLLARNEDDRGFLRLIHDAATRSAGVTGQLLAFSRRELISPRVFAVCRLVDEMGKLLRGMVGEDVELTIEANDPELRICMDPSRLEQVLVNLVVNARDAMPRGGQIHIEVGPGHDPEHDVAIVVSDSGEGIEEELHEKIFDPFFTTKALGKGTGLGLATVNGIVQQSGGSIEVDSEVGRGTSFRITLPRSFDAANEDRQQIPLGPGRGKNVLVVDDNPGVRRLVREVLERAGHTVLVARSGFEALAMLQGQNQAIDLLVTDVVMPGMNGVELHRHIHALHPNVHVLYLTGYSEHHELEEVARSGDRLLSKPFSPGQLAAAAHQAIDAR